jgi:hypothetical protein
MTDTHLSCREKPRTSVPGPALHSEIVRIIGNARFEHNVCLMARGQYGMGEFGRLFYLLADLSNERLQEYLDLIDEVRKSHRACLRCSIKFLAFCRFFCGIQLPVRLAGYETEYAEQVERFGPGRDFMGEVREAIDRAKPVRFAAPPPSSRLRNLALKVFPTEIRVFRGDFER